MSFLGRGSSGFKQLIEIESDDEIRYWRSKMAPGKVLPHDLAENLAKEHHRLFPLHRIVIGSMVISLPLALIVAHQWGYSAFKVFIISQLLIASIYGFVAKSSVDRGMGFLLKPLASAPRVRGSFPIKSQVTEAVTETAKSSHWLVDLLGILSLIGFTILFEALLNSLKQESVLWLAAALLGNVVLAKLYVDTGYFFVVRGASYYSFPPLSLSNPFSKVVKLPFYKDRSLRQTLNIIAFLVPFFTLLALDGINEEHSSVAITAENIANIYDLAVFGKPETRSADAKIIKWNKPLFVYLNDEIAHDMKDKIKRKLSSGAAFSGLKINYNTDKNKFSNLHIELQQTILKGKHGDKAYINVTSNQIDGHLIRETVTLSPHTFSLILRESYPDEKFEQENLDNYLSNSVVFASLGIMKEHPSDKTIVAHPKSGSFSLAKAVLAIHYDKRVLAGARRDKVIPVIKEVSQEIISENSFADWFMKKRGILPQMEL